MCQTQTERPAETSLAQEATQGVARAVFLHENDRNALNSLYVLEQLCVLAVLGDVLFDLSGSFS